MSTNKRGPRSAEQRVRGLLKMLPWLMQRESVAVADMAREFGMSEADLVEDIEMAAMCGVPPYTPLELTEIYIDEGWIMVGVNKRFERRLQLTKSEAFGLQLLAAAAEDVPGFKRNRELRSAMRKLRNVLGRDVVDVDVESPEFLPQVMAAVESREMLAITYWTPARNEESTRTITVHSVFNVKGNWYASADDDRSGERRHFRVDRIRSVQGTGRYAAAAAETPVVPSWFATDTDKTVAELEIAPQAAWVVETYPCVSVEERVDGSFRARMVVTSEHWLGRLLLRAGGNVKVTGPSALVDLQTRTAEAVLARYANRSGS